MRRFLLLLTIFLILPINVVLGEGNDPFSFSAPKDWRSERIPFPLDFAPELNYKGFEELRFAPGMFKPESNTYFTYAFFWWVEGNPEITSARLNSDMVNYFKGLCAAVGKARKIEIDLTTVKSDIKPATAERSPYKADWFKGAISTPDPFNKGTKVDLNVEVTSWQCNRSARKVVFFLISPQPYSAPEWQELRAIRDSFRCEK